MRPSLVADNRARIFALLTVVLVYTIGRYRSGPFSIFIAHIITSPQNDSNNKAFPEVPSTNLYYKRCDESRNNLRVDGSTMSEKCKKINRLVEYCVGSSSNNHKAAVLPRGAEGATFNGHEKYSLKHVLIAIRHGDRTSIHKMPGAKDDYHHRGIQVDEPQGTGQHFLDDRVQKHLLGLPGYSVLPIFKLQDGERVPLAEQDYFRISNLTASIDRDTAFSRYDSELPPGQLTSLGYMQHADLGKSLAPAYSGLISTMSSGRDIYVRSTNYERTVQSVAALLSHLVPGISGPDHRLYIRTHPDESDEIMHGIGIRLSSHHVTSAGEAAMEGACSAATSLGRQQRQGFHTRESVELALEDIFGADAVKGRLVSDLVDAAITRICHNQPMPCSSSRQGVCMGEELLGDMMTEADRLFCERYNGADGGRRSTMLATYPFMSEISSRLHEAALSGTNGTKMTILSGHDTVIGPVLASLDVYKNGCTWPPYASRIVFELWQQRAKDSAQTKESYISASSSFVRVIYNGRDVSGDIPRCQTAAASGGLCPLAALKAQVDDMLGGAAGLKEACARGGL